MTERRNPRWRMTLGELCHRVGATPAELEEWARLGALGPRWRETTENKWHHITRAAARRAVVMRAMIETGLEPGAAALLADATADDLGRGLPQVVDAPAGQITIDPGKLDLP